MRAHLVANNLVVNTVEVESIDFMPGLVSAENGGSIGDSYIDGVFIKPLPDAIITAKEIRKERDRLLTESDWTQVLDAPVDRDAWATYRQALRDIPQQAGFPTSIDWPAKP